MAGPEQKIILQRGIEGLEQKDKYSREGPDFCRCTHDGGSRALASVLSMMSATATRGLARSRSPRPRIAVDPARPREAAAYWQESPLCPHGRRGGGEGRRLRSGRASWRVDITHDPDTRAARPRSQVAVALACRVQAADLASMIFYTTDSETDEYCICDEKKLPLVTDMHRRRTFGLARHVLVQGSLQRLLQTSWQSYFQKKRKKHAGSIFYYSAKNRSPCLLR